MQSETHTNDDKQLVMYDHAEESLRLIFLVCTAFDDLQLILRDIIKSTPSFTDDSQLKWKLLGN